MGGYVPQAGGAPLETEGLSARNNGRGSAAHNVEASKGEVVGSFPTTFGLFLFPSRAPPPKGAASFSACDSLQDT